MNATDSGAQMGRRPLRATYIPEDGVDDDLALHLQNRKSVNDLVGTRFTIYGDVPDKRGAHSFERFSGYTTIEI